MSTRIVGLYTSSSTLVRLLVQSYSELVSSIGAGMFKEVVQFQQRDWRSNIRPQQGQLRGTASMPWLLLRRFPTNGGSRLPDMGAKGWPEVLARGQKG